ncbi:MAG: hypothetical protein R3B13_33455 [Polyangiaceae bacterium]
MSLRKLNALIGAGSLAALAFTLDPASASGGTYALNGYACQVYSFYSSGGYTVSMYTSPGCTGSYIATPSVRSTFWSGAEGYQNLMFPAMVTAVSNDTRITGTYTTSLFGTVFDNLTFRSD